MLSSHILSLGLDKRSLFSEQRPFISQPEDTLSVFRFADPTSSVLVIDPLDLKIRLHEAFKEAHIRCTDIEG